MADRKWGIWDKVGKKWWLDGKTRDRIECATVREAHERLNAILAFHPPENYLAVVEDNIVKEIREEKGNGRTDGE